MKIEPFRPDDTIAFLKTAVAEGWVAEPWEIAFLLTVFPQGCYCTRDSAGKVIAFVTSLQHETSGWIGNLIVAEEFRGRGLGGALFRKAKEALDAAGVKTYWLTASKMGQSLYEKNGFSSIDTIVRWVGTGRQRRLSRGQNAGSPATTASIISADRLCWGDRRESLLAATVKRGRVMHEETGFIVVQPCGEALQLGPFSALDSGTAEGLLEKVLGTIPPGAKFFLDAPASNRPALRLFKRKGMRMAGRNELMYAGDRPDYRPEMLYGLATMGSCG
jgi:ribosomal protein S18 acetylase RimI-like enzyme